MKIKEKIKQIINDILLKIKNFVLKEYSKPQFEKHVIMSYLENKLPKNKNFSLKDVVKKLKDLLK